MSMKRYLFSEIVAASGGTYFGESALLSQAARTAGLWIGRFKRVLADTRREVERELGAEDIRRQLHNEAIMKSLHEPQQAIESVLKDEVPAASEQSESRVANEDGKP